MEGPLATFPASLSGPLCWTPTTSGQAEKAYILQLSTVDISDIKLAIASFKGTKTSFHTSLEIESCSTWQRASLLEPFHLPSAGDLERSTSGHQ